VGRPAGRTLAVGPGEEYGLRTEVIPPAVGTASDTEAADRARLLEYVPDAIVEIDERLAVTTWSTAAERLYGWAAREVVGGDVGRAIRWEMTDARRAEMRRRTIEEGRVRMEALAFRRDGTPVDVDVRAIALRDAAGALTGFLEIHRDIGERKRLEREQQRLLETVRALQHRRETIHENITDAFVEVDGDWRCTDLNDRALRRMQDRKGIALAREDVIGRGMWEMFPEAIGTEVHRRCRQAMRERRAVAFESCFGSGGEWIEAHVCPSGFGLAIFCRDVTTPKVAELERRAADRRTDRILEGITDAFYAVDRDWRLTYLNARAIETFAELRGRPATREELLGQSLWDVFPAVVGTSADEHYRRAVRDGQTAIFEYAYPGGEPWFDVHAYPSEHGLSVYFRDVTDRKNAEREREARARQQAGVAGLGLRALASDDLPVLMQDAVAVVAETLDTEVVGVAEMLPDREELLLRAGVGWRSGAVGDTVASTGRGSMVGYTIETDEPVVSADLDTEERFRISAGLAAEGPASGVTVVIPGRDEPYGVLAAFSRRRRTFSGDDAHFLQAVANIVAAAVERARAEARMGEVRETERSRIARDLHDEALQDLTYVLTQACRPADDGTEAAERLERLVPALTRVGEQLRGAIYDLRLGGEAERAFPQLLHALVEVHQAMAADCEVELELGEAVPERPLGATGTEVLRILGEALTNARRHARPDRVVVRVRGSARRLSAEVADDGRGFDPLAPSATADGTGIRGMRERAALVDGHLLIRSEPGGGTRVRLDVPLATAGEDGAEQVRVLLVEDHAAVREAMASALERDAGLRIVGQAASLGEARALLDDVDVAVLDLGLPDGYGADLIAELRNVNPRAQALVLSATLDRGDIARAVERGAAGVVNKTASLDEVVDAVRRVHAGEPLLALEEILELLRYAGRQREREHADRQAIAQLTVREHEVLQGLADGLNSQQIADRLFISIRTERNHIANILGKLGVHSQLQALVLALRHDVIEIR
jgi:PAS domain S-box-containing protein